ncbi:MAG: hypothetical protein PUE51_07620 [Veillonellaceae bacterium]|nr:hypothetical protein [Veillonellaceae bacterium]MDD6698196.1 hypothetical protein [Veillonellaceae bacterium]
MEEITYAQLIMTIFSAAVTGFIARLWRKIDKRDREREEQRRQEEARRQQELAEELTFKNAMREGMRAMLRDHIIQTASKSMKQGHTQVCMVENMTHMFNSYTDLGGNGGVRHIFDQFMELPVVQEEAKKGGAA